MRKEVFVAAFALGFVGTIGVNKAYEKILEDGAERSTPNELRGSGYAATKSDNDLIKVEGFASWGHPFEGSWFGAQRGRKKIEEVCGPIISEDLRVVGREGGGRTTVINIRVPNADFCFPKQ